MLVMPRRLARLLSAVVLGVLLASESPTSAAPRAQPMTGWPAVDVELVTDQLEEPVYVTHAGDGSGRIWGLREQARGEWNGQELLKTSLAISSFGEDEAGEVYVTSLSDNGRYRLTAAP